MSCICLYSHEISCKIFLKAHFPNSIRNKSSHLSLANFTSQFSAVINARTSGLSPATFSHAIIGVACIYPSTPTAAWLASDAEISRSVNKLAEVKTARPTGAGRYRVCIIGPVFSFPGIGNAQTSFPGVHSRDSQAPGNNEMHGAKPLLPVVSALFPGIRLWKCPGFPGTRETGARECTPYRQKP